MMTFLENTIDWICGHQPISSEPEPEPSHQSRWIVDVPPRNAIRLGSFRTKQEALDARREHIIRTIKEAAEPIELPF